MKTVRLNTTDIPQLIRAFIEANPDVEGEDYSLVAGAMMYFDDVPSKSHAPVKSCVKCGKFLLADTKNFPPHHESAD